MNYQELEKQSQLIFINQGFTFILFIGLVFSLIMGAS